MSWDFKEGFGGFFWEDFFVALSAVSLPNKILKQNPRQNPH